MFNIQLFKTLIATAFLLYVSIAHAYVTPPITKNIHTLPKLPRNAIIPTGKRYFHILPYTAHDIAGRPLEEITAHIVDIENGAGDWISPKPDTIAAFTTQIPKEIRGHIAIYYNNFTGWVIAPRNWILFSASMGVDGNSSYSFVAPGARANQISGKSGWMITGKTITWLIGAGNADGIIPGVHQAVMAQFPSLPRTPAPQLVPKPERIMYPNSCTAVFRYRTPNSPPVHAVVYFGPYPGEGDIYGTYLYLALPNNQSGIADFILNNFRKQIDNCGHSSWPSQ